MVSSKHANFLINIGNASASDIEILGQIVQEKVINKFKIVANIRSPYIIMTLFVYLSVF